MPLTIKEIVAKLGGDRAVAAAIDRRPSAIRNWIRDGYIPPKHHDRILALASDAGFELSERDLDP